MNSFQVLLSLTIVIVVSSREISQQAKKRVPKQISKGLVLGDDEEDRKAEGTEFDSFGGLDGGGGGGDSKYFMDTIWEKPSPDLIEFGHVFEDPNNWEQRYERLNLEKKRRQGQLIRRHWTNYNGYTDEYNKSRRVSGLIRMYQQDGRFQHLPKKDHYEFGFKRGNDHHFIERHEKAHPHVGHFKTKVKWGDKHGGHGEHYWDYNHHGTEEGEGEGDEASEKKETYQTYEDRTKREETSNTKESPTDDDVSLTYNPKTKTVVDQNTGQVYALYPIE